jgi:hypothetical protein
VTVYSIGSKALARLPGISGTVLAAVSKTAYLLTDDNVLLWIAENGTPMHQRAIQLPFDASAVRAGMTVAAENTWLRIGSTIRLDLAHASHWQAPMPGPGAPREQVSVCLDDLLTALGPQLPASGLAPVISLLPGTMGNKPLSQPGVTSPLLARAREPIMRIIEACARRDPERIATYSRDLIGLGPGLTPSGDDFVGGVLFALHAGCASYPTVFPQASPAIAELVAWAEPRTNRISAALLHDLAEGQGPAPLHDLIIGLLDACNLGCVLVAVSGLVRVGHSSGWDMLAGGLTGMLMIVSQLYDG